MIAIITSDVATGRWMKGAEGFMLLTATMRHLGERGAAAGAQMVLMWARALEPRAAFLARAGLGEVGRARLLERGAGGAELRGMGGGFGRRVAGVDLGVLGKRDLGPVA